MPLRKRAPRTYSLAQRQQTVDAARERMVAAARELLEATDPVSFSIDEVARRAGVARMTVYNQFQSRAGLMDAVFDSMAAQEFAGLKAIFAEDDAVKALDAFVATFGRFWTKQRKYHERLRALTNGDDALAAMMEERKERRRGPLAELVKRLGKHKAPIVPVTEAVNVLFVVLSFENFSAIAGPDRTPEEVIPVMQKLARGIVGV